MLIGTPAYMAPEADRREPLDARSDQFGLCVAMWEALTGERSFVGATYRALARAVIAGGPRGGDATPPDERAVRRKPRARGGTWHAVPCSDGADADLDGAGGARGQRM